MQRSPLWVELYLGIWGALAIPLLFAGLVFLVPGFYGLTGGALLAIAIGILAYLWFLTRPDRRAWNAGVALHLLLFPICGFYVVQGPRGLAWPALVLNVYSLIVLVAYRRLWLDAVAEPRSREAAA